MNLKRTQQRVLLFAVSLTLMITHASAFRCPEHCSCMEIQRSRHSYNQATCTSLDGLRPLGKSADIHSLILSNLNLTKITNQFDKFTNLTRFDFQNNSLSEVNHLSGRRVRVLNLSHNRITSGKLMRIPVSVKHLNLAYNDITYLPLEFANMHQLRSLELAGNPLNCTCETLQVRNLLQERNVWTDTIVCMAPLEVKGRPWLQVRQDDICDDNRLMEPRTLPFASPSSENDLMHGDDPNALTDEDASVETSNDELNREFLPVIDKRAKRTDGAPTAPDTTNEEDSEAISEEDFEGSGSEGSTYPEEDSSTTATSASAYTDEVYEGSGDDEGLLRSGESETTTPASEEDSSTPVAVLAGFGSENVELSAEPAEAETSEMPVVEERINKIDAKNVDAELLQPVLDDELKDSNIDNSSLSSSAPIRSDGSERHTANLSESKNAYILLAVLGVLLVLLILYVATKRSRTSIKNRRNNNDVEHVAQELADMDKSNLGKPIAEFIPLIPGRYPGDKENNLHNAQEPLLKKLTENDNESNPSHDESKLDEDTKQHNGDVNTPPTTPISNGIHSSDRDTPTFQSISPKPSRYSPVYSHDTGRVKIKISETAKPKTPILVTRTPSNAGDNTYVNEINP